MNILSFMIQSMSFVKTFLIQESKLIDFLKTTWVSSQDKFYWNAKHQELALMCIVLYVLVFAGVFQMNF